MVPTSNTSASIVAAEPTVSPIELIIDASLVLKSSTGRRRQLNESLAKARRRHDSDQD